jgi:hypothetical protein
VRLLEKVPYLYTDVIGIRIIIPTTPTVSLGKKIESEISMLGVSKEPDLRRIEIPPDINWAAAHFMLIGLFLEFTLLRRKRKVTGPVEIQFTGQTTVQAAASKSQSAHTQVHIGHYEGELFESNHHVMMPTTWLDVIARAAAAQGMPPDEISTYTRSKLHTSTRSGHSGERLPLDGKLDRGMYYVTLTADNDDDPTDQRTLEQTSVPRIDEMVRAIPFSAQTTKELVLPAIYNYAARQQRDLPAHQRRGTYTLLNEREVLHLILRAHGSSFKVHLSPESSYILALELQRLLTPTSGMFIRGVAGRLNTHITQIENVRTLLGEYDANLIHELVRTLIDLYISGEIPGDIFARAGKEAQMDLDRFHASR